MINRIVIKNIALIENLVLEFDRGLTVMTGETGAGKSIIIDSISLLLGGRANKDLIRTGQQSASVEAMFSIENAAAVENIRQCGVEIDEDNALLLYRSITVDGKTQCRANGKTITLGMLKGLSAALVDICGQHEHQSLLNPSKHIELIDSFAQSARMNAVKAELSSIYKEYKDIQAQINSISGDSEERASKTDLYSFQINELDAAKLKPGEEAQLNERKKNLSNFDKLQSAIGKSLNLLYSAEGDDLSAADKIARSILQANIISSIDSSFEKTSDKLHEAFELIQECTAVLNQMNDSLDTDPDELDRIEARLDKIYNLKRKYALSGEGELLEHLEKTKKKLELLISGEDEIKRLTEARLLLSEKAIGLCTELSSLRKDACTILSKSVMQILAELGMESVHFDVQFEQKPAFGQNGWDNAEFLISPNPGEPLKPLTKIASGGEMSRIMLALKNILISADDTETLVFDEIDAGISGKAAQKVAEKLARLSGGHQLLCVSHLPQIAAMSDHHFLIEKKTDGESTHTYVSELNDDLSVNEIARLVSGAKITETSLNASREMKTLAEKFKISQ